MTTNQYPRTTWQAYTASLPYAQNLYMQWQATMFDPDYEQALNDYILAMDQATSDSRRYELLQQSRKNLAALKNSGDEHITTDLALIRVLTALGQTDQAAYIADLLFKNLAQNDNIPLDRPFLPPSGDFDHRPVQGTLAGWLRSALEKAKEFSQSISDTQEQQAPSAPADPETPPQPKSQAKKISRNAKCPCGSGKKVKKCCGEDVVNKKRDDKFPADSLVSITSSPLDKDRAKQVVHLGNMLTQNPSEADPERLIRECEGIMQKDPDNIAAFYLLTQALLASDRTQENDHLLPLDQALEAKSWGYKRPLYHYWFDYVKVFREVENPQVSVVVISNKFKQDTVENLRKLSEQCRDIGEIILVNNGCQEQDFEPLKHYADTYVRLKGNAGAYLARNMGAVFGKGRLFMFVDDDGIPEDNFVQAHIDIHKERDIMVARGVYWPKNPNETPPRHYYLGDQIKPALNCMEGNCSYRADIFARTGGWADFIFFGHGGAEFYLRLLEQDKNKNKQVYIPGSVLRHDYYRGEEHARDKRRKQVDMALILAARDGRMEPMLKGFVGENQCLHNNKQDYTIVKAGSQKFLENYLIQINWVLTRKCTYECSYCTVKDNKNGYFHSLEKLKIAADNIHKIDREKIEVILTGGEPTIQPDLIEFIKYLTSDSRVNVNIITNLSRNEAFFKSFFKALGPLKTRISFTASYHHEYADKEKFISRAQYIADNECKISILLLAHPEHMEDIKKIYNEIKQYDYDKMQLEIKTVRENFGPNPDKRYSKASMEWINSVYDKDRKEEKDTKGNIVLEINNKTTNEKIIKNYSANQVLSNKINKFKGMSCYAGISVLSIDQQGNIDPAVCFRGKFGNKKNIYRPNEKIGYDNPIKCPFNACACLADIAIPKTSKFLRNESKNYAENKQSKALCSSKNINKITFIYPGQQNIAHGLHYSRAQQLAEAVKNYGISSSVIGCSDPAILNTLLQASKEVGHVIYTGTHGYDLWMESRLGVSQNVFDMLGVNVIGTLGDHPYTSFMWDKMERCAEKAVLFSAGTSLINEFKSIYPHKAKTEILSEIPPNINSNKEIAQRPLKQRPIDLLVPLGLHKFFSKPSLEKQLQPLGRDASKVGETLFNVSLEDYHTTIFEHFQNIMRAKIGKEHTFSSPKTKEDRVWLHVLSAVDWSVRMNRRVRLLKGLFKLNCKTQIAITASPQIARYIPELQGKENVRWLGEVSSTKLEHIYTDSKVVLNCNPTYPDLISERVRNAMACGCCVISDYQLGLDEYFVSQYSIIFTDADGKNLKDLLDSSLHDLQNISDAGREVIENTFTFDKYMTNKLTKIERHIQ